MAKPCTPHLTAQRVQLFELLSCNVNFLWEGLREGYLFFKKRYPSLITFPCMVQGKRPRALGAAIIPVFRT